MMAADTGPPGFNRSPRRAVFGKPGGISGVKKHLTCVDFRLSFLKRFFWGGRDASVSLGWMERQGALEQNVTNSVANRLAPVAFVC